MKNNSIHENAVKEIINIMNKYDCSLVETYEFNDTPAVIEGIDWDDTYNLDCISVEEDNSLIFSCSTPYESEEVTSDEISTDTLIEILEWLEDNEDELFSDEDDEDELFG